MAFGRRRVAAAVCVLPLVLAGCAGDPEPKLAPPSETPTTESSPSATPTREPWEKKTNAGAVAFAKHWIDVFNEAQRTGDTEEMLALSSPMCEICSDFAKRLDRIHSSGGFYESAGWKVLETSLASGLPEGEAQIALRIRQSAEKVRETAGAEVVRNPESVAAWSAKLEWTEDSWLLSGLEFVG